MLNAICFGGEGFKTPVDWLLFKISTNSSVLPLTHPSQHIDRNHSMSHTRYILLPLMTLRFINFHFYFHNIFIIFSVFDHRWVFTFDLFWPLIHSTSIEWHKMDEYFRPGIFVEWLNEFNISMNTFSSQIQMNCG